MSQYGMHGVHNIDHILNNLHGPSLQQEEHPEEFKIGSMGNMLGLTGQPRTQRKPIDAITNLPGCGPKRGQLMNNHGIYSYADLLAYPQQVPGISEVQMNQMKQLAQQELLSSQHQPLTTIKEEPTHVSPSEGSRNHTWYGLWLHLCKLNTNPRARHTQQLLRAKVDVLMVQPHRVVLRMIYRDEKGDTKARWESPMMLAHIHLRWMKTEIVSDDEDVDDDDQQVQEYPVLEANLPFLMFTEEKEWNPEQRKALKFCFKGVKHMLLLDKRKE